jgi:hypothetical protein
LGSFTINAGATLQFGTGTHMISGSTTDNGKVEVTDGTLEIAGATSGSGSLQVDAGATLQLDGADSLNVTFTSSTGKLILKDPGNFSGTISGLTGSDQIDLANINWQAAQVSSVNYSATTNVTTLVITDGQHISTILLVGDYTSSTWTFSSDGSGGTIVVDPLKSVVALSVTDSTSVVDTTTSSSDPAQSSSAIAAAADVATGDTGHAPTAEALIFSVAGLDFSSEHIRFEDTDARPTVAVNAFDNDSSSSSHSGLLWLADFVHGEADNHFATLVPADWAPNVQSNYESQAAKPGVAHVELENSFDSGKNLSSIDPSSQAAPHSSSTVAVGNPSDGVAQPSLPIPAADAPPSDRDASPPADHLRTDADQHLDDAPQQAKAHLASESPAVDREDQDPATGPTATSDKPTFDHNDAATVDPDPGHAGSVRHADDLPSPSGGDKLSNTSTDDKPAFDHNDAAAGDSNVGHAGQAQHADDLPSQPVEYKVSDTSADDNLAFQHKDSSTVDSNPGHADSAPHLDGSPSQSSEHQLSDTSEDGGAGHPHQPLSPIATSAPQPIQLSSEAAPPLSSDIAADGAAHDTAPASLRGLGPHAASDTSGLAADPLSVHANAVPQQLVAAPTQTATHPLASYMASLPTDQFQFSDLNTNNAHKVAHDGENVIANPVATQTLLDATTAIDHSASLHDITAIPGTELLISHAHQAAVHAHNGIV